MAAATTILGAFNNHFIEFMDDVERVFPDDRDIKKTRMTIEMLRKANPRAIIMFWRDLVARPYAEQIRDGDISFFIEKDYTSEVSALSEASAVTSAINRLRGTVREMSPDNLQKSMKYIQNLSKLSEMYSG
jgi:hypothetical protein